MVLLGCMLETACKIVPQILSTYFGIHFWQLFLSYCVPCHCRFIFTIHECIRYISMVFCQKGPTGHAYAWQIGPFWQDTLDMYHYETCTYLLLDKMAPKFQTINLRQSHQWKLVSFLIEVCSLECDWWDCIAGLDNGLVTKRWHAIFYTNDDLLRQSIYATLKGDELTKSYTYATLPMKKTAKDNEYILDNVCTRVVNCFCAHERVKENETTK